MFTRNSSAIVGVRRVKFRLSIFASFSMESLSVIDQIRNINLKEIFLYQNLIESVQE